MSDPNIQEIEAAELNFRQRAHCWENLTLAKISKVDSATISKIKSLKAKPTHQVAWRLATALGVKPSAIFPSLFDPKEFDPNFQSEKPRSTVYGGKPIDDFIRAKVQLLRNEKALSDDQCRLLAEAWGFGPNVWRAWPLRFDRNNNPIKQGAFNEQKAPL